MMKEEQSKGQDTTTLESPQSSNSPHILFTDLPLADRRALCRESILCWAMQDRPYEMKPYWHSKLIDRELHRLFTGESDSNYVMISQPPRTGKTMLAMLYGGTRYLAMNPDHNVWIVSHNQTIADKFGRQAKMIFERHAPEIFGVRLDKKNRSNSHWGVHGHEGSFNAIGWGGSITGNKVHVLILDDLIKDTNDALSRNIRDQLWDWWDGTASQRIENGMRVKTKCLSIQCLAGDSRVLMAAGHWKQIKNVKAGQWVMSYNSGKMEPARVIGQRVSGRDKLYRLKTKAGEVRANAEHPFLCFRFKDNGSASKNPEWVRLKDIKKGDMVVVSAEHPGSRDVAPRLMWGDKQSAWLLGFIYGDGWIVNPRKEGHNYRAVCIAHGDKPHVEAKYLDCLSWKTRNKITKTKFGYHRVDDAALASDIHMLTNIGNCTAHTKRLPAWLYQMPIAYRREFLDGFLAADGHERPCGRSYSCGLCNKRLADDLRLLAKTCGYSSGGMHKRTWIAHAPNSPTPTVATGYWISISKDRKDGHSKFRSGKPELDFKHFSAVAVMDIIEDKEEDVYDLAVEGNESFIANGFVVHNTRWHVDDLNGRLIQQERSGGSMKWRKLILPAIADRGDIMFDGKVIMKHGDVLCPEILPRDQIENLRRNKARYWWETTYQQRPLTQDGILWSSDLFTDDLFTEEWPQRLQYLVIAVDPATGRALRDGDYSSIVALGIGYDGKLYTEASMEKSGPQETTKRLMDFIRKMPMAPDLVGIESQGFQFLMRGMAEEALKDEDLQARIVSYDIEERDVPVRKEDRIAELDPLIVNRDINFIRSPGTAMLVSQLQNFPSQDHDDGPDALELASWMLAQFT